MCSRERPFWRWLDGQQPIKARRGVEPNARKLQIRLAHFGCMRLAGPFNAFCGQGAIMRGRFHGNAPIPSMPSFTEHCVEDVTVENI
jgi:hypothetical protein